MSGYSEVVSAASRVRHGSPRTRSNCILRREERHKSDEYTHRHHEYGSVLFCIERCSTSALLRVSLSKGTRHFTEQEISDKRAAYVLAFIAHKCVTWTRGSVHGAKEREERSIEKPTVAVGLGWSSSCERVSRLFHVCSRSIFSHSSVGFGLTFRRNAHL